jgi:hypothetical protein
MRSTSKDLAAIAARIREQLVTPVCVVVFTIAACGGGPRGDTYARATDVEQQCCEHLAGGTRDKCLAEIVRVDDAKVRDHPANQSTYRCVTDNFACDATTGHATQTSAQAQLECIQDLPN